MLRIYLIAGIFPALYLVYRIYRLDYREPEPIGLLVKLFFLGGLTTFAAGIIESIAMYALAQLPIENEHLYNAIQMILIVGFAEEGVKRFVLERWTWNNPEFNCRFDAVVYAVAVAAGFAAFENVMYLFNFGLGLAPSRAILAIPMHVICGIFMGHYFGEARLACNRNMDGRRILFRRLSLFVPAIMHGIYDLCATEQNSILGSLFFVYVVVVDVIALYCVKRFAREDVYIG